MSETKRHVENKAHKQDPKSKKVTKGIVGKTMKTTTTATKKKCDESTTNNEKCCRRLKKRVAELEYDYKQMLPVIRKMKRMEHIKCGPRGPRGPQGPPGPGQGPLDCELVQISVETQTVGDQGATPPQPPQALINLPVRDTSIFLPTCTPAGISYNLGRQTFDIDPFFGGTFFFLVSTTILSFTPGFFVRAQLVNADGTVQTTVDSGPRDEAGTYFENITFTVTGGEYIAFSLVSPNGATVLTNNRGGSTPGTFVSVRRVLTVVSGVSKFRRQKNPSIKKHGAVPTSKSKTTKKTKKTKKVRSIVDRIKGRR